MANVIVNDENLTAIANAIRAKNESANTYLPSQMAAAINAISTGKQLVFGTITAGNSITISNLPFAPVGCAVVATPATQIKIRNLLILSAIKDTEQQISNVTCITSDSYVKAGAGTITFSDNSITVTPIESGTFNSSLFQYVVWG